MIVNNEVLPVSPKIISIGREEAREPVEEYMILGMAVLIGHQVVCVCEVSWCGLNRLP